MQLEGRVQPLPLGFRLRESSSLHIPPVVAPDSHSFTSPHFKERLVQALSLFKNATHARLVFHCAKRGPSGKALVDFIRDMQDHATAEETAPPVALRTACPKLRYFFVTAAVSYEDGTSTESAIIASESESPRGWIRARAWRLIKLPGPERGQKAGEPSDESAPLVLAHEEIGEYAAKRVIEAQDLGLPEEWEVR